MFHTVFTQPNNGLDKHTGEISGLGTGENRANWSRTQYVWSTPLCYNVADVTFPATSPTIAQVQEFVRRRRGEGQQEANDDKGTVISFASCLEKSEAHSGSIVWGLSYIV